MSKAKAAPKLSLEQRLLLEQMWPLTGGRYLAVPEYRFHPTRKWRIDVAILWRDRPELAIEIDGGIWVRGRHSGGAGQLKDMEKHNELAVAGWRVVRFTPQQVRDGSALEVITRCLPPLA